MKELHTTHDRVLHTSNMDRRTSSPSVTTVINDIITDRHRCTTTTTTTTTTRDSSNKHGEDPNNGENNDGAQLQQQPQQQQRRRDGKGRGWKAPIDDSLVFATRVTCNVALASLFVVLQDPTEPAIPEAYWTYISVILLAMVPTNDTATTLRKTVERLVGTIVGALAAAVIGALLYVLSDSHLAQSLVLVVAVALESWSWSYLMYQLDCQSLYAAMLTHLTFGLVLLTIYQQGATRSSLRLASDRLVNICIGCTINAIVTLTIWPQSTHTFLQARVQAQYTAVGQAAQGVLRAAHEAATRGRTKLLHYAEIRKFTQASSRRHRAGDGHVGRRRRRRPHINRRLQRPTPPPVSFDDSVYNATVQGFESWQHAHDYFPLLQWDPFFVFGSEKRRQRFVRHVNGRAARAFFLQTTVALLDTLVRSGTLESLSSSCLPSPNPSSTRTNTDRSDTNPLSISSPNPPHAFEFLYEMGTRVQQVLDCTLETTTRDAAAEALWCESLPRVRTRLAAMRASWRAQNDDSKNSNRKQDNTTTLKQSQVTQNGNVDSDNNTNTSEPVLKALDVEDYLSDLSPQTPPPRLSSSYVEDRQHLFFQLCEQLIVRSIRAYAFWESYNREEDDVDDEALINDDLQTTERNNSSLGQVPLGDTTESQNLTESSCKNTADEDIQSNEMHQICLLGKKLWPPKPGALYFAARVSLAIVFTVLFVVIPPRDDPWPASLNIFFPAAFMSWLPGLDTASTIGIALQGVQGTLMAAAMAFGLSPILWVLRDHHSVQSATLFILLVLQAFVYCIFADKAGLRKSFAGVWAIVIAGVFLIIFYENSGIYQPWKPFVFWFINPFITCGICTLVVTVLGMQSTRKAMERNAYKQAKAAGVSAGYVLQDAHDWFVYCREPVSYNSSVRFHGQHKWDKRSWVQSIAYDTYVGGFVSWRNMHLLFPRLAYDPLHLARHDRRAFETYLSERSAMTFFLQNTVVLIDTIVRSSIQWRLQGSLNLISIVGERVQQALDLPTDLADIAVESLLSENLPQVRNERRRLHIHLGMTSDSQLDHLVARESFTISPLTVLNEDDQMFLFFHLLEHLIRQTARLHRYCKLHMEYCRDT